MVNRKIEISKEEICMYLHLPITEASAKMGVSISVLKKRCRGFGIRRWPYRKIRSYEKKVSNLEQNLLRNPEKSFEIVTQIQRFARKREVAISHPEKISSSPTSSQSLDNEVDGLGLLENGVEIEDSDFFNKIHQHRNSSEKVSESTSPVESCSGSPRELSDEELLLSLSNGTCWCSKADESNSGSDAEVNYSDDKSTDTIVLPPCSSFDMVPPAFVF